MTSSAQNLTLEEIGKLAGVSRSTVSRVLNDHPDVREEVRARVESVIDETGYLPNQAARALVSNRTGLVGLVMPTDADELFGDPYYSALVHGIQAGCLEHGSTLSIFPVDGSRSDTTVVGALAAQGFVDGLIVTAGPGSEQLIETLRGRVKHMVVVGRPGSDRGVTRVDVQNRLGSAHAVAHLFGLGRQRIGFVGPTPDFLFGADRLDGYREALAAADHGFDERLVSLDEPTFEGGQRAAAALLPERPDALHVATDTMAAGALNALRDAGMRVPDDVAVVGFDGLARGPRTDPTLTTVVQPMDEVGRTAVRLLLDADARGEVVMLPTRLRLGESCGGVASADLED